MVAAVNAIASLRVTASGTSFPITLTARNAGLVGNSLDARINSYGAANGEVTPAGLTVSISGFASGAVNPDVTDALASLGSQPMDLIGHPYTDSTNLNTIRDFLDDSTGRWSWEQELYGHAFTVVNDTVGAALTLGEARNDQHASIMSVYRSPTPVFQIAASLIAAAAQSLRADPGLPLQTLQLVGCLAPQSGDQYLISDRETLLENGISTTRVNADGTLRIERVITTYQFDAFATPDTSYLNVERMFLIMYTARYVRAILESKYARVKLADDGTRIPQGSNIVTPSIVRGELIAIYGTLLDLGICQDLDTFAANVVCQRNVTDVNRLDVIFPADFIDQLNIVAILLQFTP